MRAITRAFLAILLLASPALAQECPVGNDFDAKGAAIRATGTCRSAAAVAKACGVGSGGDVALTGIVSDRCERDFLAGLDRRGRAAYARQRAACLAKYRACEGSMYRSAEAFCEAGVAERFSRRALAAAAAR